jgi:hypothetical protein
MSFMTIIKRLHVSFIEHEDVLILLFKFITSLKDKIMKKTIKKVSKTFFASFFVFQFVMVSALMPISAIGAEEIAANFSKETSNVERSEVSAKTVSSEESVSFDTKIGAVEVGEEVNTSGESEDVSSKDPAGGLTIGANPTTEAQEDNLKEVETDETGFEGSGEASDVPMVIPTKPMQQSVGIYANVKVCKVIIDNGVVVKDWTEYPGAEFGIKVTSQDGEVVEYNFDSNNVNDTDYNFYTVCDNNQISIDLAKIDSYESENGSIVVSYAKEWFSDNYEWNDTYFEGDANNGIFDSHGFLMSNAFDVGDWGSDGVLPLNGSISSLEATLFVVNEFVKANPVTTAKIIATKIVCESEDMLPNWGGRNNPGIVDENTANNFVQNNSGCEIDEDWKFQYASAMEAGTPNPGNNLDDGGEGWTTFVGSQGVFVPADPGGETNEYSYWVREVMQNGYIPFSGTVNTNNDKDFDGHDDDSAEIYCQFFDQTYGQNYDNYDQVLYLEAGQTYYCVAFNAPLDSDEPVDTTCPAIIRVSEDGRNGMIKVSKKHPNWTNLSGAEWVWDKDPLPVLTDRQDGGVFEVTEQINISGNPQNSVIKIAADNVYSVVVNGNIVYGDPELTPLGIIDITSSNSEFWAIDEHTIPASYLNTGLNTIVIRAVNQKWPNPITEDNVNINPAGLVYALEINHDCVNPEPELCRIVDAILVYPDGKISYSKNLPAGTYIVKAKGTYTYRNLGGQGEVFLKADALFSERAPGDTGYDAGNPWRIAGDSGNLGIKVNGAHPSATWGTEYNSDNDYSGEVVLNEDGTITFQITDSFYGDNSGYLTVTIWGDCDDTDSTDSTDPGCTEENCGGGGSSSGGGSGGGSSSGGGSVLGDNDGEILGATSCVAFTTYNRLGNRGGEIKALQTFLNEYMNAGLVVDGIYGHATTQAVHDFQAYHWKEVIDPWTPPLSPNTTGWQYKSTRATINTIIECPEAPVFLEDPMTNYSVPTVEDKKPFTAEQIQKIYDLLIEARSASSVAL